MKKLIHTILKGLSITAALFVFQACYGSPQPPVNYDEPIETKADEVQQEAEDARNRRDSRPVDCDESVPIPALPEQ